MSDAKLVLAKKKELLEECRRRKKERELHKVSYKISFYLFGVNSIEILYYSNGTNTKACMHAAGENGYESLKYDIAKEFENLTADEILKKCGINDLPSSASSTLTPSSSTHSFSSSNHSIFAILNSSSSNTVQASLSASCRLRGAESTRQELYN